MPDSVEQFYDQFADTYHLIFADWEQSVMRQGGELQRLINEYAQLENTSTILDCSAGIGTQAIGLAKLGYEITATDISPLAIEKLKDNAKRLGVAFPAQAADMRTLAKQVEGQFDGVISVDNSVPHLLTDADLKLALENMKAKLNPDGLLLITIRDYDALREERPTFTSQRLMGGSEDRRVSFQVWDWADDGETYTVNQFILTQEESGWQTEHFSTEYRAMTRQVLGEALTEVGFKDVTWVMPHERGFYQPIV